MQILPNEYRHVVKRLFKHLYSIACDGYDFFVVPNVQVEQQLVAALLTLNWRKLKIAGHILMRFKLILRALSDTSFKYTALLESLLIALVDVYADEYGASGQL